MPCIVSRFGRRVSACRRGSAAFCTAYQHLSFAPNHCWHIHAPKWLHLAHLLCSSHPQVDFETAADRLNARLADTEAVAEARKGQMQAELNLLKRASLRLKGG